MDKAICTVPNAVNWLGNRGVFTRASNIRVRGRWALVKEEWSIEDNEVECYHISGSMYAEPYSAIKYTDSPFIPNNKDATEKALITLEHDYKEYCKEYLDEGEVN